MSGGQSCDVSVRDPAGGAENFVLATPPPACGGGGHETPPPVVKMVVRLTRSFQDLATRRALYETWTDETYKMETLSKVHGGKWKKFDKKLAVSGRCYKL